MKLCPRTKERIGPNSSKKPIMKRKKKNKEKRTKFIAILELGLSIA